MSGLNIDLIKAGATGPLSWLNRGRIDVVGRLEVKQAKRPSHYTDYVYLQAGMAPPKEQEQEEQPVLAQQAERVYMHFDLLLSNLAASVPLATPDLSYLAQAGVRPVVAYLNANYTQIPLAFDFEQPMVRALRNCTLANSLSADQLSGVLVSKRSRCGVHRYSFLDLTSAGRAIRRHLGERGPGARAAGAYPPGGAVCARCCGPASTGSSARLRPPGLPPS